MREKDFENKVKAYLKEHGAWFLKTWSNGIQREGVPDILACVRGHFVGIELKAEKGHPSDLQLRQIRLIRQAGGIGVVLYPKDFDIFKEYFLNYITTDRYSKVVYDTQKRFDMSLTERERRMLYGIGQ